MHLIQMFIPVRDKHDTAFPKEHYAHIRETLTIKFGGLTAYNRAPAEGLWKDAQKDSHNDALVIFEAMAI